MATGRNSALGKLVRVALAASLTAASASFTRSVSSSSRSSGLRGSAPWAAMRRRSLGTPPRRNCSIRGFVTRASDIASAAVRGLYRRGVLHERGEVVLVDHDVPLDFAGLAQGHPGPIVHPEDEPPRVAHREHQLA